MATTKCPFCAEEIQEEAIFCKHCQRMLSETVSQKDTVNPWDHKRWGYGWLPGQIVLMWFLDLVLLFGLYPTRARSWQQTEAVLTWLVISIPVFVITWRWLNSQETKEPADRK